MPASKARKAMRERQLKAAEAESSRLQNAEITNTSEPADEDDDEDDDLSTENPGQTGEKNGDTSKPASKTNNNSNNNGNKRRKAKAIKKAESESSTKSRFIVFVGKLPFSATSETIAAHFSKLKPSSVRHLTDKQTGRSRGCAFLEFERYDQMEECLKQFHHSLFDDGLGGEKRKINIELTVGGGGGKSRDRKEKLRIKNDKLAEERHKRASQRKEGGKPARPRNNEVDAKEDQSGIHPSRLARMQH